MLRIRAIRLVVAVLIVAVGSGLGAMPTEAGMAGAPAYGETRSVSRASDNPDEDAGRGAGTPEVGPPLRRVSIARAGSVSTSLAYESESGPDGREIGVGMLLMRFRPGVRSTSHADTHRAVGALSVEGIGVEGIERVRVARGSVPAALAAYRSRPDVEFAEPDYIARASIIPNDPRYGEQWGMTKIGAPQAWDLARSNPNIRIAILDCGIYSRSSASGPEHVDVRDKVVAEINLTSSPNGADDFCNHGTHVAGIAAASTNNGVGVAGVGFNASIMNVKVLDDTGQGLTSTIAQGIVWATDNGARVINMSLGGTGPCSQTYQNAANYAWARNVVLVAAAGNEGLGSAGQPANCNRVMSVAATDQLDRRASFSNFGPNVDVAAPGVGILSTNYVGSYEAFNGTSQATPHVAGLAALIWGSSYGTSNQAVVDRISNTADRIAGTGTFWTFGRINAAVALAPSCPSPRPRVGVTVSRSGADAVVVTVVAGSGTITTLNFDAATNALIDAPDGQVNLPGGFTAILPAGTVTTSFVVRRAAPGPVTVPLRIVDGCGEWRTFVGRGIQ